MQLDPHELVKRSEALAALPNVMLHVTRLVDNPDSSAANISRIIEQDARLAERLLRMLNSPYYNFPSTIDTIARAITVIGLRDVRDLLLAAVAVRAFDHLTNDLVNPAAFWRHSLYCAVVARMLAERRREEHPERFFLAGLLHDVGNLILCSTTPDLARECLDRSHETGECPHQVEQSILGITHSEVGCALAEGWRLPPSLCETIRHHHTPRRADRYAMETSVIHIADFAADSLGATNNQAPHTPMLDPQAWRLAGLPPMTLESTLEDVNDRFIEMQRLLFNGQEAA